MDNRKIKIKRGPSLEIPDHQMCTFYKTNGVAEIISSEKSSPYLSRYRKMSGNYCMDTETGEAIPFKKSSARINNPASLQKTFVTLRRTINNNFTGDNSERHVTLTYREHMTHYDQCVKDFKNFWLRLKRKYPSAVYIRILEPQQNGRWHIHALIKVK